MTTPTSWVHYALQALGLSRPREYTYEEEKEYEPQSDPYVLRLGDLCACPGRSLNGHNDGCPKKEAKPFA